MTLAFDPSQLSSARLKEAFAYWDSKRAGRTMPSRRDIDPAEIVKLLPYVMLIDVITDPLDFRYRLMGTELSAISHHDYTGKRFSEVEGKGSASTVWQNCEQVVRSKAPYSRTPPYIGPERHVQHREDLLLPLSADGVTVNMIFLVVSFELATA